MKEQLDRIEAKLDRVIKALQDHDGLDEDFNEPEDEYAWKYINPVEVVEKFNRLLDEVEITKQKPEKRYYKNKKKSNGN
jgi:hypothetical protein